MTTPTAPVEALRRAEMKLSAYVGVCKGDKELTDTVLPMVREALAALTASPATDEEITPAEAAKRDVEAVYVKHGPALVEALLASPDAHMGHSPEEWNRLMAECPVPATDEGTLKRGNGTGGWTIDTDLLRAIRDDAGEWAKESCLETVQAIALAVEHHLSRARVAPATDDIGRLVERLRAWADDYVETSEIAKLVHESATALLSQQSENNRLTRELIIAQEDDKISRDFLKVSDSRCAKAEELLEAFLQFDSEAYDRKSTRAKALVALKKRARAALPKAST